MRWKQKLLRNRDRSTAPAGKPALQPTKKRKKKKVAQCGSGPRSLSAASRGHAPRARRRPQQMVRRPNRPPPPAPHTPRGRPACGRRAGQPRRPGRRPRQRAPDDVEEEEEEEELAEDSLREGPGRASRHSSRPCRFNVRWRVGRCRRGGDDAPPSQWSRTGGGEDGGASQRRADPCGEAGY